MDSQGSDPTVPSNPLLEPGVSRVVQACIKNADDLVRSARTVMKDLSLNHIAYHLAALAIEEIGKCQLFMMNATAREGTGLPWLSGRGMEDHVRKLFFAFWGVQFAKERIAGEQIRALQGLAGRIHETRLRGTYVDAHDPAAPLPWEAVSANQAHDLVSLAEALVVLEKQNKPRQHTPEEKRVLSWFLEASENPEKRRYIVGPKSMEKLAETGRPLEWMAWLKGEFDRVTEEGRAALERELQRQKPGPDEEWKPKWKVRFRLHTNSHSVRQKVLNSWNNVSEGLQLIAVPEKKNQLLVEFVLPKRISHPGVWWVGWATARRIAVSLNMGSMGFFWWYVPQQISRFYERITDLEAAPNIEVVVERSPALRLDWGKNALSEEHLNRSALALRMLPHRDEPEKIVPFDHYIEGLIFLSKTDIHLEFVANAFEGFWKSLKSGMKVYGDWDGICGFGPVFHARLAEFLPNQTERDRLLKVGEHFDEHRRPPDSVTLSDAGEMKLLCDVYFVDIFDKLRKLEDETPAEIGQESTSEANSAAPALQ